MEVQQMKAQAKEEKARNLVTTNGSWELARQYMYTLQAERELLLKERKARIEAEREKEELMKRLQQYEAEAKAANQALVRQ